MNIMVGFACLIGFLSSSKAIPVDHFFSGYLFEVFEDDKPTSKSVCLRIDAVKSTEGDVTASCDVIYILTNEESKRISLESHHSSTSEGTLEVVRIDEDRLILEAAVSQFYNERRIQIVCDRAKKGASYTVKAVAIWPNVSTSGSTKVEWRQVNEIKLPSALLIVPSL